MKVTLNQLIKEFEAIADAYQGYSVINSYWWGSFYDAINRDAVEYPLMVATIQPGNLDVNRVRVTIAITLADKYNEGNFDDINNIHSDLLRISSDIRALMRTKRWKSLVDVEQNIPVEPFINKGSDLTAGWVARITFNIDDYRNFCAAPLKDYDYDNPVSVDPGILCDPATYTVINSLGTELISGEIESGAASEITIDNGSAVLKDSAGVLISTTPTTAEATVNITAPDGSVNVQKSDATLIAAVPVKSNGSANYPVADSNVSNSNDTYSVNVKATEALELPDVQHTDSDGSPVTLPGMTAMVCTPCAAQSVNYNVVKTAQTTSYRTGDDGDLEDGHLTSWLVLEANNPYGNTTRFLNELGTAVFASGIAIDWSTNNPVNQRVLGYKITVLSTASWNSQIDACVALSIGGFATGWKMVNVKELFNLTNWEVTGSRLNYAPFNIATDIILWTSTTRISATNAAIRFFTGIGHTDGNQDKAASNPTMACRYFTYAELGL